MDDVLKEVSTGVLGLDADHTAIRKINNGNDITKQAIDQTDAN